MKMQLACLFFIFCLITGVPVTVFAEPPGDPDRPPSREQMEKVRKKIETMRMWKLTTALDLDEKSSAQLFPVLNKFDKKRAESEAAVRDSMRELRDTLKEKNEAKLKGILDKLEQGHKGIQKVNDEERTELRKILTVEQQARFILFQQEFSREVREMIGEARDRRGEGPGREQRPVPRNRFDREGPGRPDPGR